MNIYEAAKVAKATGMAMQRTKGPFADRIHIIPTNSSECCIISNLGGSRMFARWQPRLDDLTADDWAVWSYTNYEAWRSDSVASQSGTEL